MLKQYSGFIFLQVCSVVLDQKISESKFSGQYYFFLIHQSRYLFHLKNSYFNFYNPDSGSNSVKTTISTVCIRSSIHVYIPLKRTLNLADNQVYYPLTSRLHKRLQPRTYIILSILSRSYLKTTAAWTLRPKQVPLSKKMYFKN